MGTNYYAHRMYYGHEMVKHIGKSSAGWPFIFATYEDFKTAKDWKKETDHEAVEILDEYGRTIHPYDFWTMVDRKKDTPFPEMHYDDWEWYKRDDDGYWFATDRWGDNWS